MPDIVIAAAAILLGVVAAVAIAIAMSRSEQAGEGSDDLTRNVDGLAAGILREVALLGGATPEAATEVARARTGWEELPDERIDIATWGEAFAEASDVGQRQVLLESAVAVAMSTGKRLPAPQYSALLALSFALGFHTDALARLRERLGFDYDDWARLGRPRDADRSGGGAPLFERRNEADVRRLLAVLGLEEEGATRHLIVSAYRHLAAESHPDRFHDADADERRSASDRFLELSAAYQTLMQVWDRD